MPEQSEKKYYMVIDGEYEEIKCEEIGCLGDIGGKDLPVKSIISANNKVSISIEASKFSSAMKRLMGFYRGKRKTKHFYRK